MQHKVAWDELPTFNDALQAMGYLAFFAEGDDECYFSSRGMKRITPDGKHHFRPFGPAPQTLISDKLKENAKIRRDHVLETEIQK